MTRTLLALLLICFVSLHAAVAAAATVDEPVNVVSVLVDDTADGADGDGAPASPHTGTKCHDGCSWLAKWNSPDIRETHRSPMDRRARIFPSGLISLVVPPPR